MVRIFPRPYKRRKYKTFLDNLVHCEKGLSFVLLFGGVLAQPQPAICIKHVRKQETISSDVKANWCRYCMITSGVCLEDYCPHVLFILHYASSLATWSRVLWAQIIQLDNLLIAVTALCQLLIVSVINLLQGFSVRARYWQSPGWKSYDSCVILTLCFSDSFFFLTVFLSLTHFLLTPSCPLHK